MIVEGLRLRWHDRARASGTLVVAGQRIPFAVRGGNGLNVYFDMPAPSGSREAVLDAYHRAQLRALDDSRRRAEDVPAR